MNNLASYSEEDRAELFNRETSLGVMNQLH